MVHYELTFTVPSPGGYTTFIEFSPSGRFLAVVGRDSPSLYILDKLAGFHPTLSTTIPAKPTALVWEPSSQAFYVGLDDGRFIHYRIDLEGKKLVEGVTNHMFHGAFPVTSMALDTGSKTLVLSVGPGVFAFRRIRTTSEFRFTGVVSSRFSFPSDPGSPTPPFPRSMCFTPNNTLVVTFCRQHIASIVLELDRDSHLHSSFQTARIDYTGLPVLKAVTSASEEEVHRLTHCWVYGDSHTFPFLFINGGAATLSSSSLGVAIIRDTVTQREIQSLGHAGTTDHHISAIAYHVSASMYSIVTAGCGENATINVWTARRSYPRQGQNQGSFARKGLIAAILFVASIIIVQGQMGRIASLGEIFLFFAQATLIFVQICTKIGNIILEVVEEVAASLADSVG